MINTELSTGTFLGNLTCMLPKEEMEEYLPKSITNFSDNSSNSNHHIPNHIMYPDTKNKNGKIPFV